MTTVKTTWYNLPAQIDLLLANQRAILAQGVHIMSELSDAVAVITQAVADADTAIQKEIAALTAAIVANNPADVNAAVSNLGALSAKLKADTDAMTASLPPA